MQHSSRSTTSSTPRRWRTCADYRFTGDVDGYAEGELYFPGLPRAVRARHIRRMRAPRDAGAVDLQSRHRDRVGRRPHGQRRRRPPADRDGFAAHPRAGRRRRGTRRLHRRLHRIVESGGQAQARRTRARHQRARLHAAARGRRTVAADWRRRRSRRRSTRWAWTPHCSWTPTTSPQGSPTRSRWPGPQLGAVRIDSGDLGVLARQVRDQLDGLGATEDPHRGLRRPRRVRHRRAARRARRHLRRRHLGGDRIGRAYREHGLQAGRGRRHSGGETQQPQGIPRRPQTGAAPGQAVGHHRRGDRASGGPAASDAAGPGGTAADGRHWCGPANRSPTSACKRRGTASARACTACPGTG